MTLPPAAWVAACALCVLGLIVADRLGRAFGRVVCKMAASSCFVALAVALGAAATPYGQWVLTALALGWVGDACLLSRRAQAFAAGLAAFLLSHLAYAVAFVGAGLAPLATGVAALGAAGMGVAVLRLLIPHVPASLALPVRAYVTVILLMCATAIGHAVASSSLWPAAGAILFAASDLAVARDRFIRAGFVNQLWGWPAYFAAQLVLAATVASPG